MSSATEQLRAELTKRGVEWEAFDDFEQTTQWSTHNGAFVYWARERDGKLLVETTAPTKCSASCTPKQAIEATLGPGTCHNEAAPNCSDYWFCCSECEFVAHTNKTVINYCPNCGKRCI